MATAIDIKVLKTVPYGNGPALFCIQKNETYFMPHFFEYYRNLGIEVFLIYDDHSDAETTEYLIAQPDCAILQSDRRFGDTFGLDGLGVPRRLPMILKESIPDRFFPGRWVLSVDADEFLVLPLPFKTVGDFTAELDRTGDLYVSATMVDFYGETLGHRNYAIDRAPFSGSPYFDAGPYYYWTGGLAPIAFTGGVRYRLLRRLCQSFPDRIFDIFDTFLPSPAKSWKIPLLKQGSGIKRIGDHEISTPPRRGLSAAIAHFKFYPGLDDKIEQAMAERQYWNNSSEYRFLQAALEHLAREPLACAETRTFDGPLSLEQAGLIIRDERWIGLH